MEDTASPLPLLAPLLGLASAALPSVAQAGEIVDGVYELKEPCREFLGVALCIPVPDAVNAFVGLDWGRYITLTCLGLFGFLALYGLIRVPLAEPLRELPEQQYPPLFTADGEAYLDELRTELGTKGIVAKNPYPTSKDN